MHAKVQFSLRSIFILTAVVAFVVAEMAIFPSGLVWFIGLIVGSMLFPALSHGMVCGPSREPRSGERASDDDLRRRYAASLP